MVQRVAGGGRGDTCSELQQTQQGWDTGGAARTAHASPDPRSVLMGTARSRLRFALPGARLGGRFITLRPSSLPRGPLQFRGGQSSLGSAPIEATSPWALGIGSASRGGGKAETRRWSCCPAKKRCKTLGARSRVKGPRGSPPYGAGAGPGGSLSDAWHQRAQSIPATGTGEDGLNPPHPEVVGRDTGLGGAGPSPFGRNPEAQPLTRAPSHHGCTSTGQQQQAEGKRFLIPNPIPLQHEPIFLSLF